MLVTCQLCGFHQGSKDNTDDADADGHDDGVDDDRGHQDRAAQVTLPCTGVRSTSP